MGGSNSNRWGGYVRRRLVNEGLCLIIGPLVRNGTVERSPGTGSLLWRCPQTGEQTGFAKYNRQVVGETISLQLQYDYVTRRGGEWVSAATRITCYSTTPHFGGERWWFRCPRCGRKSCKLYRPWYQPHFACRLCHELTYYSAQAHDKRIDAMTARIGKQIGYPGRLTPAVAMRMLQRQGYDKRTAKITLVALS